MNTRGDWLELAQNAQPENFPFSPNEDEALALLPFYLALKHDDNELDSQTYDQLRDANLPHSLRMAGWDLARLAEAQDRFPEWHEFLDDAYHARRPHRGSRRLRFEAPGVHGQRSATYRGATLDTAKHVIIAMHGRGAAADRLTRDLEAFLPATDQIALIAPQATDNAWYPNPAYLPPEQNQPYINDTLAVIDSLWSLAREHVSSQQIILCCFSQGDCAALTWARTRDAVPLAVMGFSGFQIEVGGSYQHLGGSFLYSSRSEGDEFCTDRNMAQTLSDLKDQAPHALIHTDPGSRHIISEHDGQVLRKTLGLE